MTEESLKKASDLYGKITKTRKEIIDIEQRNIATQYKSYVKITMHLPDRGWITTEFQPDNTELLIENYISKIQSKLKDIEIQLELLT